MTASEILSKLGNVRPTGENRWKASCPLPDHDDRNPSMSVTVEGDRVLMYCHRCNAAGDTIAAAMGLSPSELFIGPQKAVQRTIEATYDYVDEAGQALFQVVRLFPKDFRQRHLNGEGWTWNTKGIRRVLYRLPEVIEAVALGKTIYVVEGEKDVASVEWVGGVATTCPGGAGKWRDEYSETLRGARVVVVVDQDEPGRKHADEVASSLRGVAATVEVVRPASGNDAADHLKAGHGLEDFVPLDQHSVVRGLPRPIPVLDLPDEGPPEWTVDHLLLRGDIFMAAGDGGVGKTSLLLHMAAAISGGTPAFGHFKTQPGPVLFVSGEDGQSRIRNRVRAIANGQMWSLDRVNRIHVLARQGANLDTDEWRDHLKALAAELEVVAVFLDPLRDLTMCDLNADQETAPLMRWCREVCELPNRPAIAISHHAGKQREGTRKLDRIRGASALNQAPRSIVFMSRRQNGVTVEQIKLTDAVPLPTFAVEQKIVEHLDYVGLWDTAQFGYVSLREAETDDADEPVLKYILEHPGSNSTTVRDEVQRLYPNLSPTGISEAMKRHDATGRVKYVSGPRGAKLRYGSTCAEVQND